MAIPYWYLEAALEGIRTIDSSRQRWLSLPSRFFFFPLSHCCLKANTNLNKTLHLCHQYNTQCTLSCVNHACCAGGTGGAAVRLRPWCFRWLVQWNQPSITKYGRLLCQRFLNLFSGFDLDWKDMRKTLQVEELFQISKQWSCWAELFLRGEMFV